jgi:uracil-DNA glycosylase
MYFHGGIKVQISKCIKCKTFPCTDVRHDCYITPDIDLEPDNISVIMISEAAPTTSADYYYGGKTALFQETTVQAFNDAGAKVSSIKDILNLGVYVTTAVKCGKTGYGIKAKTIEECSMILEKEIALFPAIRVFMLMGDVAIKALNYISKSEGHGRVIPAGSTYKIRNQKYYFKDKRTFPSYLQAGRSFFIEKSKRRMIAQDIAQALDVVK